MKLSNVNLFKTNRIGLYVGPTLSRKEVDYKLICPFARYWTGIGVAAIIGGIFTVIGYSVLTDAVSSWQQADDLFTLFAALFTSFWLIGWSLGIIIPIVAMLAMAFGRLVVLVHSGRVDLIFGVPGLALRISGAASEVTNVRLVESNNKSVFPGQGMQIEIETGPDDKNTPIGSDMTTQELNELRSAIELNKEVLSGLDSDFGMGAKTKLEKTQLNHRLRHRNSEEIDELSQPITMMSGSTILLVLANLIPLIGVLFFDWDLGSAMVLYWAESGIILFYTVAKGVVRNTVVGIIVGIFTIAHAGAFMAIHFLFIWIMFVQQSFAGGTIGDDSLPAVAIYFTALWPALLGLFISHGYSFKTNFIDKQSTQLGNSKIERETDHFYSRITLMHITLIIGGGLALIFGDNVFALSLLIFMKIVADLKSHLKQHSGVI